MTIYLDVLLLSNLWADYALLRTTAALTHAPLRPWRCLLAAAVGAVSALSIFLPPLPVPALLLLRILLAVLLCGIAFGFGNRRILLRQTAVFFGCSLLFCGAVWLLASRRTPAGWYLQNTVIYADISLLTLLLGTTAAAAIAALWERRAAANRHRTYRLHLRIDGMDFSLPALADSGNTLRDVFSGKPVIVCGTDALRQWLAQYPDAESAAADAKGFRMLPVRTVTGTRLLPAFLPDYAALEMPQGRGEQPLDILLALSGQPEMPAVIPACCVPESHRIKRK
ncbi:MAG: sigma-E processing peptidase SpoIIGA [Oscillospiraceae bacterium]|nr:sigma-E processing peptidase SpoIIGA [Oscillospiraceae bacterium]